MSILEKRIPTLIVVVLLLVGVAVTSLLVQQRVIVFQHAAPSDVPQNIRITNVSDDAFTVTYTTDASVPGTLALQKDKTNPQVVLDDRDEQSGIPKPYTLHSISAKGLSPNTSYSFTILSGTTTYANNNVPFSLTTPPQVGQPTQQTPLSGKLLLPNGTVPPEALVFATANSGQLLSTVVDSSGLFIIPLNTIRTKDLSSLLSLSPDTTIQILAISQQLTSHVAVALRSINPLPPITLSQDYDFTLQTTPIASGSATANFPVLSTNTQTTATPHIITPQNNESFTDTQPQFQGVAAPNSSVTISIHSTTQTIQTKTNGSGQWTFRPTAPLAPGEHTITVTSPDQFGILHTITQSFLVFAAGTQVASATPSATLAPTPTPTPIPTKIPTLTPTLQPSITTVATPTMPPTPTAAKPTGVPQQLTPHPTLPPTGSNTIAIAGIAGIATTVIGIVLFFVTNGATL